MRESQNHKITKPENPQNYKHDFWDRDGVLVLSLFVMLGALAIIYRRLLVGRVLANGDLHTYFFPYWTAAARAFQAGRLPLWSPYLFGGVPLLANSQVGVLYPLNWPLWLLSGPTLAGMARTLHISVLLHLALAAVNVYVLARRLGAHPWGATVSGLLYAGSGFLGLHVEHLNQLQGLAWLPLVLMPLHVCDDLRQDICARPTPVNVLAMTMILLTGHTQTAFITVIAVATWRLALIGWDFFHRREAFSISSLVRKLMHLVVAQLPFAIAGLIAAAQLLPTFELSRLSMRSGGLPWREAVSFSVRPWEFPRALLPPYLVPLLLPEGVAYVGLIGIALAGWGVWSVFRKQNKYGFALLLMGGLGGFLALGGYNPLYLAAVRLGMPGVVHFRAPARYLTLYVLAGAILAGMAFPFEMWRRDSSHCRTAMQVVFAVLPIAICVFVSVELLASAEYLPHADATVPRTYTDLRPATAHLVAASAPDSSSQRGVSSPGRFLSISKTLFDAGDETEIDIVYGDVLSDDALWAYKVAAKHREVLSPNFPLAFQVPAVDGYDGGILPTQHYVAFSRLLLPEGTLDGRLRENLSTIPDGRWLSLLGVRFLITDKTGDAWADDVFYDQQFQLTLLPNDAFSPAWMPVDFAANALGVLYAGAGEAVLEFENGQTFTKTLPNVEGEIAPYRLRWEHVGRPHTVTLRASDSGLRVMGASLIDERTAAFYLLALSDRFRLAHSGDVKIYENLDVYPRALLLDDYVCAVSDVVALDMMRSAAFDPATQVVLSNCDMQQAVGSLPASLLDSSDAEVEVVAYEDTRIVVQVTSAGGGILVLTDAWYPGWRVRLEEMGSEHNRPDTKYQHPLRADLLFRAVMLEPGMWRVTFKYQPLTLYVGGVFSAIGFVIFCGYIVLSKRFRRD